jgi:hypothetical protein
VRSFKVPPRTPRFGQAATSVSCWRSAPPCCAGQSVSSVGGSPRFGYALPLSQKNRPTCSQSKRPSSRTCTATESALTLPSSGHPTAGHVVTLRQGQPRRWLPLMSNVRAPQPMRSASLRGRAVAVASSSVAVYMGRPSAGGRRTVRCSPRRFLHRRVGLSVLRPAHRRSCAPSSLENICVSLGLCLSMQVQGGTLLVLQRAPCCPTRA